MDFDILYEKALAKAKPFALSATADAGGVGAAILTDKGNVYTGTCIDIATNIGFCAERAAAAAMVSAGERIIKACIAVTAEGEIIPPCGVCREFLNELADENARALVKIGNDHVVELATLLPEDWRRTRKGS